MSYDAGEQEVLRCDILSLLDSCFSANCSCEAEFQIQLYSK